MVLRSNPREAANDQEGPEGCLPPWRVLCLAFKDIDVEFLNEYGRSQRFKYSLRPEEAEKALWSFRQFPPLAKEFSRGMARISYHVEHAERPLTSLSPVGCPAYWPAPPDVFPELLRHAPLYDSIFVLWPQSDVLNDNRIPSPGWGLAIGPGHIPGGATYCSIANAPGYCWDVPLAGEVWLHEWLHGICDFFESKGFTMPECNADGGGLHGYTQSPVTGWCQYYEDLMTGQVLENGRRTGITPEAWLSGTIRSQMQKKSLLERIFKK
ncbi:MAG TPA: hypothetical protein VMC61_06020 [Methanocella sp.]|nr:hypothetical protein [Methanocella sp.]